MNFPVIVYYSRIIENKVIYLVGLIIIHVMIVLSPSIVSFLVEIVLLFLSFLTTFVTQSIVIKIYLKIPQIL